jgi:hypothetical protein
MPPRYGFGPGRAMAGVFRWHTSGYGAREHRAANPMKPAFNGTQPVQTRIERVAQAPPA